MKVTYLFELNIRGPPLNSKNFFAVQFVRCTLCCNHDKVIVL